MLWRWGENVNNLVVPDRKCNRFHDSENNATSWLIYDLMEYYTLAFINNDQVFFKYLPLICYNSRFILIDSKI